MKKLVFFIAMIIILYVMLLTNGMFQQVSGEEGYEEIPDEAIRLRILANSDGDKDQDTKLVVRDEVNKSIADWVADIDDIDEARAMIQDKMPEIEDIVQDTLAEEGVAQHYEVDYGKNVSFPTKKYGNFVYPAGEYEAVVITLGEGEGKNWWCVLFPPLCFLDFSEDTTVAEAADGDTDQTEEQDDGGDEVEIKFFLLEWLGLS